MKTFAYFNIQTNVSRKKFTVEGSLVIEGLTVGRCNPCVTPTNGGSSRMENIASALIATRVTEP